MGGGGGISIDGGGGRGGETLAHPYIYIYIHIHFIIIYIRNRLYHIIVLCSYINIYLQLYTHMYIPDVNGTVCANGLHAELDTNVD